MIRISIILISVLVFSGCVSKSGVTPASESSDDEYSRVQREMCEKVMCQYNVRVKLKTKDGTTFEQTFDMMPVVQEEGVMVVAGQTVYFEADVENSYLINLKLVSAVTNPDKTVTAKFEQMDDGGMMLSLRNPFDKHLRIKMGIMPLDKEELYATSSCPVIAKGGSFEMWPYPIFQVWLGAPRLLSEGENMGCVE
ncbi:MAG: hypothetical protein OQK04_15820 [Kangiellaceae bacterium]|nr:hypothetical protein [Kangiellaceae bacterium]MCW9000176.1 hypothetical protein [Kangiellaceae bacterium]